MASMPNFRENDGINLKGPKNKSYISVHKSPQPTIFQRHFPHYF